MKQPGDEAVRQAVRKTYGEVARAGAGCGCSGSSCCAPGDSPAAEDVATAEDIAAGLGYSGADVSSVPEEANMGLGCGNPQAIASLRPGEAVLDLGSGGGFDCFLAARAVGENGRVVGVDMTAEMITKARENAAKAGPGNVEFRLGEIENLPVADGEVDAVMSNCVINLSPDKPRVYREAFRVLKPGGRLAIFDMVATAPLPEEVRNDLALYAGCVAGALQVDELRSMLEEAGFVDIRIRPRDESKKLIREWSPGGDIADFVVSASIEAVKPV